MDCLDWYMVEEDIVRLICVAELESYQSLVVDPVRNEVDFETSRQLKYSCGNL